MTSTSKHLRPLISAQVKQSLSKIQKSEALLNAKLISHASQKDANLTIINQMNQHKLISFTERNEYLGAFMRHDLSKENQKLKGLKLSEFVAESQLQ